VFPLHRQSKIVRSVIITRSPLRISLGGGGTDLPSYYRQYGGFVMSAAIDKYVYITVHQPFVDDLILKYSQMERVQKVEDIKHPLMREALRLTWDEPHSLEITSFSEIPAGTGLGSSGSFLTALLQALYLQKRTIIPKQELAEQACHIEIERLNEPVGKQDQYIAAFGVICCFEFKKNDSVVVTPVQLSAETLANLEDNLVLFYTGQTRSASAILRDQDTKSKVQDKAMVENLHLIKELGLQSRDALESGNLTRFAELMHVHWEHKKQRSDNMSNSAINDWYELGRSNGALGGKLIGAGGGGFLMFYTEDKTRLRHAMRSAGLREVRTKFDFQGTMLVSQS
jgi:D-glycero-alpha-D-manno-heptose-7-phosphate kinase